MLVRVLVCMLLTLTLSFSMLADTTFQFPVAYSPRMDQKMDLLSIVEESQACQFWLELETMLVRDLTMALNNRVAGHDRWLRHDTQFGFVVRLIVDQQRFSSLFPTI